MAMTTSAVAMRSVRKKRLTEKRLYLEKGKRGLAQHTYDLLAQHTDERSVRGAL